MAWNIYASVYNTVGKRLTTRAAAAQRTRVQDPKGFSDSDHEKPTKSATRTASFCASTSHYAQQNGPMEVYTPPILIHIPTNVEGFILNAGRTPGMKHLLDWHSQNLQSQHAGGKPVLSGDCSDAWTARPAHGATANGQKGSASIRADIHMLGEIDHCSKAGACAVHLLAARIPESTLQSNSGDLSVLDAQG